MSSQDLGGNDPQLQQLQAQWNFYFPSFGWDYQKFMSDPTYSNAIYQNINSAPTGDEDRRAAKSQLLNQMLDYYNRKAGGGTFQESGGAIDVKGIFDPYKQSIREMTQQRIALGRQEISRGASRASEYATESLAGTGLGRSGVAAQTFANIGTEATSRSEKLGQEERLRESERLFQIDEKIAQATYAEELRKRGMNAEDITSATNFYRQMAMLEYKGMLEQAANEPSFWEEWGGVFQMIAGIGEVAVGAFTGNPLLIAGGASTAAGGYSGVGEGPI